jgi:beta-glucanase (GH16 family)
LTDISFLIYHPEGDGMTHLSALSLAIAACLLAALAERPTEPVNFTGAVQGPGTATSRDGNHRPRKDWTRVGPLGERPRRVSDAYPLSDQQNRGNWVKFDPMSDEFEGKSLDKSRWTLGMSWWRGRQPALFSNRNVTVADGKLQLTMRKEPAPKELEKLGYHDYTSAALHTKARSSYGYYEVKARPMNSGGSSSFWFQQDETPGWQTEIDVFEIGGKAKGFEYKDNMTVHVFRTPTERKHWQLGSAWVAPWRLAEDYHVYGLDWDKDEITYYVDGVAVRRVENTHWQQPLYLIFDSETMPEWFGMPEDSDLPSTFNIEYVRAWKKGPTKEGRR